MKTVYIHGILLDGSENMEPQTGMAVITEGEKIIAIEPQQSAYEGAQVVDLKGQYIMPGLINLHVHLPANGKPKKKQSDPKKLVKLMTSNNFLRKIMLKMCEGYAKTQLMSGVTTIRTVGGVEDVDTKIRDAVLVGKIDGPRILAGNMAISVPGGHMAGSLAYEATSPEQARSFVRQIAKDKPDLIKLMITGGVLDAKVKGEPGELKMLPEIVKAACEEAHALGLQVAAHVESPQGVQVALENGVDTIEHGAMPSAEIIQLFKDHKACQVATMSPALPYALFDRAVSHVSEMEQYNGKVVFDGIVECAKECLANGIPVGLGTDTGCPYITHYDMWREVNYFHKFCGVSNAFALYTATMRNAELIGIGDQTGSIEVGKCADFIVTEKNPLEDLTALRKVTLVVARGKRYADPQVKKMPEVEQALDQFI
ncbi:amidohydrolase family protein [Holdemania filiformis]|uniref:amidohydrolase family protein n=1 Tax=Holdemania filiformis TaxID=61171 RepID=UPI002670205D|nr:amidohydrolase family protein [Holdemania filiformis]